MSPLLLALAGAASISLIWDPSTDPTVTGYNVYVGTNSGRYMRVVNAGNQTNVTVTALTPGVTYYFVATAYDGTGLESVPSNEVFTMAKTNALIAPLKVRLK